MKKYLKLMLILLICLTVIRTKASAESFNNIVTENNYLKMLQKNLEENLEEVELQLKESGKLEHLEEHKKILYKEYNSRVNSHFKLKKMIEDNKNYNEISLYNQLYWPKGGVIKYKPTVGSLNTIVLEYYDRKGTTMLYENYVVEPHLRYLRDLKSFIINKILTNVPFGNFGLVFGGFSDADEISKYFSQRAVLKAYESQSGCAMIQYYIEPINTNSSAVILSWIESPYVNKIPSEYNEVIEYYKN